MFCHKAYENVDKRYSIVKVLIVVMGMLMGMVSMMPILMGTGSPGYSCDCCYGMSLGGGTLVQF